MAQIRLQSDSKRPTLRLRARFLDPIRLEAATPAVVSLNCGGEEFVQVEYVDLSAITTQDTQNQGARSLLVAVEI